MFQQYCKKKQRRGASGCRSKTKFNEDTFMSNSHLSSQNEHGPNMGVSSVWSIWVCWKGASLLWTPLDGPGGRGGDAFRTRIEAQIDPGESDDVTGM